MRTDLFAVMIRTERPEEIAMPEDAVSMETVFVTDDEERAYRALYEEVTGKPLENPNQNCAISYVTAMLNDGTKKEWFVTTLPASSIELSNTAKYQIHEEYLMDTFRKEFVERMIPMDIDLEHAETQNLLDVMVGEALYDLNNECDEDGAVELEWNSYQVKIAALPRRQKVSSAAE